MIGLYVAGESLLHRARPGVKLLALLALTTLLVALPRVSVVAVGAVAAGVVVAVPVSPSEM